MLKKNAGIPFGSQVLDRAVAHSAMAVAGIPLAPVDCRRSCPRSRSFDEDSKQGFGGFRTLPANADGISTYYQSRHKLPTLQRALSRQLEDCLLHSFLSSDACTRSDSIRLSSCKDRLTSRWLHPSPGSLNQPLPDLDFELALRLRLGLPPLDIMPPSCALCDRDITNNPWHALGCQSLRRRSITVRHDRAMQLLVKYARSVGVLASLSPKDLSSLVPDGEFFLSRETVLVDLSGTHPLSPSLISTHIPVCYRAQGSLQDVQVQAALRRARSTVYPLHP